MAPEPPPRRSSRRSERGPRKRHRSAGGPCALKRGRVARPESVAASANARQRLEKMARAFKDGIDTLNEARDRRAGHREAADSEIDPRTNERAARYKRHARAEGRGRPSRGRQTKSPRRFVVTRGGCRRGGARTPLPAVAAAAVAAAAYKTKSRRPTTCGRRAAAPRAGRRRSAVERRDSAAVGGRERQAPP